MFPHSQCHIIVCSFEQLTGLITVNYTMRFQFYWEDPLLPMKEALEGRETIFYALFSSRACISVPWPLLNKECQQLVDNTWKLPWSRRQQKTNYIGESEKLLGAREIWEVRHSVLELEFKGKKYFQQKQELEVDHVLMEQRSCFCSRLFASFLW